MSNATPIPVDAKASATTAANLHLYRRNGTYIPRVAAVHDLCGYGKCSLGVAIPVLSAAGCDVCPVPTGLFSSHTKFPTFHMHDTTAMLAPYLDAWASPDVAIELDAIYSGFLGAPDQVGAIRRLYAEHPGALRVVDPVMGDGGVTYPTYTSELCAAMADLVDGADLLTPNLTEAAILTGITYVGQDVDDHFVRATIDALLAMGAKNVVLKGVARGDGRIRNYVAGVDIALEDVSAELLPWQLHGTGDLYASALLAAVMCGISLRDAVVFAGDLVIDALRITVSQPNFEMRGVSFEPTLGRIAALLEMGA